MNRIQTMTQAPTDLVMGTPSTMGDNFQLNLRYLFERGCRVQPDNEIVTLINDGQSTYRMTYAQCERRAHKVASSLAKMGVKPGDRVATFMWNNARHFVLYYSVPCMGAVLHTLNIRLHPKELAYIISHANDKIMIIDTDLLPLFEQIDSKILSNIEKFIICGENQKSGGWHTKLPNAKCIDFDEMESMGDNTFIWPNLNDKSGMGLCYTSGTTGNPKGVLYSHRSTYIHTLMAMGTDIFGVSGTDCILPIVPMFHALCWGFPFKALTLGFKFLLHGNTRDQSAILTFMMKEQCTLIAGVPTIMQGIRGALEDSPSKFESLRGVLTRAISGGSAPPAELIDWFWNKWGIELIQIWGMTELNPLGTIARRIATRKDWLMNEKIKNATKNNSLTQKQIKELSDKLTSNQQKCGITIPCVNAKIVDSDNMEKEVKHNTIDSGELLCNGPFVTSSYFKLNENELSKKFYNGYLVTGDIASFNNNEQMLIRDRSKDMIKTGGEWISSVDMEGIVMSKLADIVDTACVVGVSHPKWDERAVVIVKLKNNHNNNNNEKMNITKNELYNKVRNVLKGTFAKYQLPDDVLIWDEIPMTGTGKMSKKDVRLKLQKENYILPSLRKNKQSKL